MTRAEALATVQDNITHELAGPDAWRAWDQFKHEIGIRADSHTGKVANPLLTQADVEQLFRERVQTDAGVHLRNIQIRTGWLQEGFWTQQRDCLLKGGWAPEEAEYIIAGLKKAAATIDATAEEIAA